MATARDITNGALRKIGKLAGGREPRTQDASDALEALRGLYRQLINSGAFGRLRDVVPTGAAYTAGENERVFRNSDATLTIDLPELVRRDLPCGPLPYDEEEAYYPNGVIDNAMRPPRDCSVVVVSDAFTAQSISMGGRGPICPCGICIAAPALLFVSRPFAPRSLALCVAPTPEVSTRS